MADVPVVFHTPGCPFSTKLRLRMRLARLPHRSVRFRDDEDGAAAVRAHHPQGWELSPTVVVGDRYLFNPSLREVREALAGR
ncbi:glutaredoxin domain-containing protein [Geodermatophilus marinus]|uniref:glutaredoxin domain-containing protein n=1 Tax=Geodermatophilus sp. LHW52908 TaxID=2303986 RepID=UPI000E3DFA30|nr:glutaredoxin domain-containing protein [Geodermatophilus sp. LHW52908]RFU19161.1 NrdH-redoxin [Geodermatophilus sp. LHW52908]